MWDVLVPDQRIRSTVSNGWVTLDDWSEREDAEHAVRNLAGVRGITNRLEIAPAKLAVGDVRQAIEEAIERHAEREAKRIQLDVLDGSVVLSGVVESYGEREAIVGAAKGTRGVRRVDDRLRVAPA